MTLPTTQRNLIGPRKPGPTSKRSYKTSAWPLPSSLSWSSFWGSHLGCPNSKLLTELLIRHGLSSRSPSRFAPPSNLAPRFDPPDSACLNLSFLELLSCPEHFFKGRVLKDKAHSHHASCQTLVGRIFPGFRVLLGLVLGASGCQKIPYMSVRQATGGKTIQVFLNHNICNFKP